MDRITTDDSDAFFIGYRVTPAPLRRMLSFCVFALLAGAMLVGGVLALGQRNPGNGAWGPQVVELDGVLHRRPYPALIARGPDGTIRLILLAGEGKRRPQLPATIPDGATVRAKGTIIQRGGLAMLELVEGPGSLRQLGQRID